MNRFNDGRDWIFDNPLGMFIHWGIFAQGGGMSSSSGVLTLPVRITTNISPSLTRVILIRRSG
jgi:hypothetical protein